MTSEAALPIDSDQVQTVEEGKARVLLPRSVFYNKVQEFNRDLTISVISNFIRNWQSSSESSGRQNRKKKADTAAVGEDKTIDREMELPSDEKKTSTAHGVSSNTDIRILEGLAASGLRSVRFALEIPGVSEIVANDFDRTAVEFIRHNAESNSVSGLIRPSCDDAAMLMYRSRSPASRFHVIDLDPYGSPAPFLDSAVQAVVDGGLLCVTCTDMAVLCGNSPETCHAKYGAVSVRAPFCHEMALRILLQSVASHAARYQRYVEPLLSLSADFYIRVFVRVRTGQRHVKEVPTRLSYIYHCRRCGTYALQPVMAKNGNAFVASSGPPVSSQCTVCTGRHVIAGPIWSDPIHDVEFVRQVGDYVASDESPFLSTRDRILGILGVIEEELVDCPLYYVGDDLCSVLHCISPGFLPFRSALLRAGYQVSLSHAKKFSIKTNAPVNVIWDIMRCWVREHPVNEKRLVEGSTSQIILSQSPQLEADFSLHPDANPRSRSAGLVRWQMNPDRDWGPKPRASRACSKPDSLDDRRLDGEKKAEDERKKRRRLNNDLKQFPCKRFLAGNCDLGEQCRYSHDKEANITD